MRKSFALIPAVTLALAGCGTNTETATPPATPETVTTTEAAESATVVLEVTSTTPGTVHWGASGSSNSADIAPGEPWVKTVEEADRWEYWTLSATGNFMDDSGVVTCSITIDGEVVDQAQGTGSSGSAFCSSL